MNDQEFNQRAHSNPRDEGDDFKAALNASPDRQRLFNELQSLENRLEQALQNIAIPAHLEHRLKQHVQDDHDLDDQAKHDNTEASPKIAANSTVTALKPWQRLRQPAAIAASLAVAVSLGFTALNSSPSEADIALGHSLMEHVHAESRFYNVENSIPWSSASEVMQRTGATFVSLADIANGMNLTFAEFCRLMGDEKRGTHLVIQGEQGPISIMFINHHPVRRKFELQDDELRGEVVPVQDGFLAVFGTQDEALQPIVSQIQQQLSWSI